MSVEHERAYAMFAPLINLHAAAALDAAIAEEWEVAGEELNAIAEIPEKAMPLAATVCFWADRFARHVVGIDSNNIVFTELQTTLVGTDGSERPLGSAAADMEIDSSVRWAAGILEARLTRNLDRFQSLWREGMADVEAMLDKICAVLQTVALTIGSMESGFLIKDGTLKPGDIEWRRSAG